MVYECSLRLAARSTSGGPSLGRSPGAHKQRRPVNQDQIQIFRGNRVDTIFRAGLTALLFFFMPRGFRNARRLPRQTATQRMTATANLIEYSFEIAAQRCEDLTPLVYRRLFREYPETQAMFRSEGADLVKGSMLALTIDATLDLA